MTEPIEPPIRWLLREIKPLLPLEVYCDLIERFKAHQWRYNRAALLRHTRRLLALCEHALPNIDLSRRQCHLDRIVKYKKRIAELEDELDSTA